MKYLKQLTAWALIAFFALLQPLYAADQYSVTIVITNTPAVDMQFTLNGDTRTWKTNATVSSHITLTSAGPNARNTTNLFNNIVATPFTSVTPVLSPSNTVRLVGASGLAMSATLSNQWGFAIYTTNTVTSAVALRVPISSEATAAVRTNNASEVINGINLFATNRFSLGVMPAIFGNLGYLDSNQTWTAQNIWTGSNLWTGSVRVSNQVNFVQTGVTWAFDGGRYHMGTNDGGGNFDFEVNLQPVNTNPAWVTIGGRRSGHVQLEGNNDVQIVIDRNNNSVGENFFYVRKDATNGTVLFSIDEGATNRFYGPMFLTNANLFIAGAVPQITLSSTNNTGSKWFSMLRTGSANGTHFGAVGTAGDILTGSIADDFAFRTEPGGRIVWGIGTSIRAVLSDTVFNTAGSVDLVSSNNFRSFGTDNRLPNQTLASSSNILTAALADIRYRPSWSWFLAAGGGNDNAKGNYNGQPLPFSTLGGVNAVVTQPDGTNGERSLYSVPQYLAGKSIIMRTTFATKVAETNYANAAVVVTHSVSFSTNLSLNTEIVPSSGNSPDGNASATRTVNVVQGTRYYEAVTTNAIPANAKLIILETYRPGTDGSDTMTTNAYFVTLDVEALH